MLLLLLLLLVIGIEVELLVSRESRFHLIMVDDAGGDEAIDFLVNTANFSTDLEDKVCVVIVIRTWNRRCSRAPK